MRFRTISFFLCAMSFKSFARLALAMLLLLSCGMSTKMTKIRRDKIAANISLPQDELVKTLKEEMAKTAVTDTMEKEEGPVVMNAIRDEASGEMVATDVIREARVVARFRHVAERLGKVSLSFDVTVPAALVESSWQLRFLPTMAMAGDTVELDRLLITGSKYRNAQLKAYQRYRKFISSIITDTTDFLKLHLLEVFLERNYPETYAMKNDSSYISEPEAENYFGVTQRQALEHYTKHLLRRRNDRKMRDVPKMYGKLVKSPIVNDKVRLDTVISNTDGDLVFRYVQNVDSRPGLKKITISMKGDIYEEDRCLFSLPDPEDLVFYVSSLSSLADNAPRYRMVVLERTVYDNTLAFLDFAQGSSEVDTLIEGNARELARIQRTLERIESLPDLLIDSVTVTASCSPEGSYASNALLSKRRSEAVRDYFEQMRSDNELNLKARSMPENWEMLERRVAGDTVLAPDRKSALLEIITDSSAPDEKERRLSACPEYRYLREKIYPSLRTVRFGFHLHRAGVEKDTVHTTELDTLYMRGVEALKNLDYKEAASILRPYRDYNAALALAASGYNLTALDILDSMKDPNAKALYLQAVINARLGDMTKAVECFESSMALDPAMLYRANLDPELSDIAARYE